jgi:tetratricopeptide (TPR) repeat protein
MTVTPPVVFISYSHADETWKDRLLNHLTGIRQAHLVAWDDRKIDPGAEWYDEIQLAMEQAAVAVCLISDNYLASDFCRYEEVPFLLKRREHDGMRLIPLLLRPCGWSREPWLKSIQMLPRDGRSLEVNFPNGPDSILGELAREVQRIIEDPDYRPSEPPPSAWAPPEKVDRSRLPVTGFELFGRQGELANLDMAWRGHGNNVVSLVGWGGVGKSTLVNRWLEGMAADNYRGARRVYGWSFFSQGTNERVTSADEFIDDALQWFGDPEPYRGSPWNKGERLAALVRRQRTLLLLDGIEPLQAGETEDRGRIKDPALATLVAELARRNPGLCVITTRMPVADLQAFPETTSESNLERISAQAGRALLRVGNVHSEEDKQLEATARAFGGHAFALQLLAAFLRGIPGRHVEAADNIPRIDLAESEGLHARRVMVAFTERFGDGPEVRLLRLLGLFDRPTDLATVTAIIAEPPIAPLTLGLPSPDEAHWLRLLANLRKLRLVAEENEKQPDSLDAHPLVREHFSEQLQRLDLEAWREGHRRIFEHLRATVPAEPTTLQEMSVLFAAMSHGCDAGKYTEVLHEVYQPRVLQGFRYYSTDRLGAYGAGLGALAGFFQSRWERPVAELAPVDQACVLHESGVHLLGVGRSGEAVLAFKRAAELYAAQEMWDYASPSARYLSEVLSARGELSEALAWADSSIEFADRADEPIERMADRVARGDILHQSGRLTEAEACFIEAEQITDEQGQPIPNLYFFWGLGHCELLLTRKRHQAALERARQALTTIEEEAEGSLLAIAQVHLALGCVLTAQVEEHRRGDLTAAADYLERALDGLRQASHQLHLPRGLLARAALFRLSREFDRAHDDVEEALRIASRSAMARYVADCRLELARLHRAIGDTSRARTSFREAREMIGRMGYHRRDTEVAALDAALS